MKLPNTPWFLKCVFWGSVSIAQGDVFSWPYLNFSSLPIICSSIKERWQMDWPKINHQETVWEGMTASHVLLPYRQMAGTGLRSPLLWLQVTARALREGSPWMPCRARRVSAFCPCQFNVCEILEVYSALYCVIGINQIGTSHSSQLDMVPNF